MVKNPPADAGDARDEGSNPGSGRSLRIIVTVISSSGTELWHQTVDCYGS